MPELVFDAETHTYRVDGRVVPSVTQRLAAAGLSPDYGGIDPHVLLHARERGLHVEACARLWAEGTLDPASVHPEALPYLDAFRWAVTERCLRDLRWQVPGYSAEDDTAGTADLLCTVGGRPAVVDVKCTYKLDRSYRVQLTAYRRQHYRSTTGHYLGRYALQLQKKGTYVLLDCDAEAKREGADDDACWRAVVALGQWRALGNGRAR